MSISLFSPSRLAMWRKRQRALQTALLARISVDRYESGTLVSALDGTFARASIATYRDQSGVIKVAASGVPRDAHYELDPVSNTYVKTLLLEGSRINYILNSDTLSSFSFSTGTGTKTVGTTNNIYGTGKCHLLTNTGTGVAKFRIQSTYNPFSGSAVAWTGSLWITTASDGVTVDIQNGGTTGTVTLPVASNTPLTRISGSLTSGTASSSLNIFVNIPQGCSCEVFAPQVEPGAFASSYIPTAGAEVTRQPEILTLPYPYALQEMSLFARLIHLGGEAGGAPIQIGDGGNSFSTRLQFRRATQNTYQAFYSTASTNTTAGNVTVNPGQQIEGVARISASGFPSFLSSVNGSADADSGNGTALALASSFSTPQLFLHNNGTGNFAAYRDIIIAKGLKTLPYFRQLITDDLAAYDSDAKAVIQRSVGAGATLVDPSGNDQRAFINSLISALKNGGAAGDCYSIADALYLPILSVRDLTHKVSKLLDGAKPKSASLGTSGYYDASQSTASLQQVLTRGDNKGNLVKYSADIQNSVWSTLTGTVKNTGNSFTLGASGGRLMQNVSTSPGKLYTLTVRARVVSGSTGLEIYHETSATTNGTAVTMTGTMAEYSTTVLGAAGGGNVGFGFRFLGATNMPTVEVEYVSVREATWDADYIATTTTPIYAGLNGKPVLMFDASLGATAGYDAGTSVESREQPLTAFVVTRKDGGGATTRTVLSCRSVAAEVVPLFYGVSTTSIALWNGSSALNSATPQETYGFFTALINSSSSTLRRNGATFGSGVNAGTGAATRIYIGRDALGLNGPHNGPIAFVLLARQPLTTAQRDHIESVRNTFFPSAQ